MDDLAKKNFCGATIINNEVIPLLYSKTLDYYSMGNSLRTLDKQTISNSYIDSVYIYNHSLKLYMSTKTNGFYDYLDFYDQEINSILGQLKDNTFKLIPIPRRIPMSKLTTGIQEFENVYSYLIYNNPTNSSSLDGAIILNINANFF